MPEELLAITKSARTRPEVPGVESIFAEGYTGFVAPISSSHGLMPATRRRRLRQAAQRHATLEALMAQGTLLVFEPDSRLDRADFRALIEANRALLDALAHRFENLVQYQVSVAWSEAQVLERFRTAPEIAPLFRTGAVTGDAVTGSVMRLADRLADDVRTRLSAFACDLAELPREQGIVSNHVILVSRDSELALDRALNEIDGIWSDGFRIRVIGPGPAASFATLRCSFHGKSSIARARARLGIPASAGQEAIHAARQLALREAVCDAGEVRLAARLAEAAVRTGRPSGPLQLIDVWSEGRAVTAGEERVA